MFLQQSLYCRSLRRLLGKVERILWLYEELVEPVMGYPRHKETLASLRGPHACYQECLLVEELESRIADNDICILGPGGYHGSLECDVIGAPEGGIPSIIMNGLKPLYVTGDLDVDMKLVDAMINLSHMILVHVHGDNIERISCYEGRLLGAKVIYTSQVPTHTCTLPIGGFTDGDRALIVAMLFEARRIKVLGYEFTKPILTHKSIALDPDVKKVKLKLARDIIEATAKTLGYLVKVDSGSLTLLRSQYFM